MVTDASDPRALLRVKRNSAFLISTLFLLGVGLPFVWGSTPGRELIGMHLAISVSFAAVGVGLARGGLTLEAADLASVVLGVLFATLHVHLTGGPGSPYFPLYGSLPCLIALFMPYTWMTVGVGGALTLGGVALVEALAGIPPWTQSSQLTGFVVLMGLSLLGARTSRGLWQAQREAHGERLEALERLTESERLRLLAERERERVERLALVGQLASGVAHEVNNPLAYVKSNLAFLEHEARALERPMDREELCEVLAETQQGVLRIQQIVADLRGFARTGDGGEEQGRLEEAVTEALRMAELRLRGRGEVRLALQSQLPRVRLGQRHLVQVLLNLLLNAVDAVEVAEPSRRVLIAMGARRVEGSVRLEVDDNGPGITEDVLAHLFQPFFTTKPPGKGMGLGLALCREYVARAGGTLHAENRPEGGARFVLVVPEAPPAAAAT